MWTSYYFEIPKKELDKLIDDDIEISALHKRFLRIRWLHQLVAAREMARKYHARFTTLRIVQIVGAILVPVLIGLNVGDSAFTVIHLITIAISVVVSIAIGLDQFSHYGEHWLHYRGVAEGLKTEGWQFLQLNGKYSSYKNHEEAYPVFTATVEEFLQEQEQTIIISIQKERVKGGETAKTVDAALQKTSDQTG